MFLEKIKKIAEDLDSSFVKTGEEGVYETKNKVKMDYFRYWDNGKALLDYIEKESDLDLDEYFAKKEFKIYFEGESNRNNVDYAVLSDLLGSGHPSNKHHYIYPLDQFKRDFKFIGE